MKRTLLAMALLLSSVFGVTGCGSDDDVPPVESRVKNSKIDDLGGITQDMGADYGFDEIDDLDMIHYDDEYEDDIDYKDLIEYDDRRDDSDDKIKINLDFPDQALKSVLKLDDIEASKDDDEIDYSKTLSNAYSNLQGLLGPDGIRGLDSETRKLLDQTNKMDLLYNFYGHKNIIDYDINGG